jgi:hypothetical protein
MQPLAPVQREIVTEILENQMSKSTITAQSATPHDNAYQLFKPAQRAGAWCCAVSSGHFGVGSGEIVAAAGRVQEQGRGAVLGIDRYHFAHRDNSAGCSDRHCSVRQYHPGPVADLGLGCAASLRWVEESCRAIRKRRGSSRWSEG